jgi:tRNA(Ile)-lysidine synthase
MIQKMKNYISQYHMLEPGDYVLCGCSGGADSVALLLLLGELRETLGITLEAVCVEHGIRGEESKEDARFVEELCSSYRIPCRVYPVDAPGYAREHRLGLEESARLLRYEAFGKRAEQLREQGIGAVKLALAHHMEDNAETMLFMLSRGSGLSGLCGIAPVRTEGELLLIRPLLWAERSQIENYLQQKGQSYRTDSTNEDQSYSRNRIRRKILPELETVNEKAVSHMSRTAEQLREIREYLEQEIESREQRLAVYRDGAWSVETAALLELPAAIQKGVIRSGICRVAGSRKDIAAVHVEDVVSLLGKQSGRKISLPYGVEARIQYGTLRLEKARRSQKQDSVDFAVISREELERLKISGEVYRVKLPQEKGTLSFFVREWHGKQEEIVKKAYTKFVDYDMIKDGFSVRSRAPGDYFIMDGLGHRKKLADYFIEEKIPAETRDEKLLLAQDSCLVWIVGGRIGENYKVTEKTGYILVVEYNGGNEDG